MAVLVSSLVLVAMSVVAALRQGRQGRELTRKLNSGTAQALRCWLRGWSEPYPGALHPGRLVAADGEPVRFDCRTGTIRQLLLPAGGLRVMQAREVTDADRLMTLAPSQANQFTLLICRDATGVRVDVAVPVAAASAAETFLLGTATATGPASATVPRPVGRIQRFVGGWTAAVLITSVVMVGANLWTWRDAERVTGTIHSSLPAGDQGFRCGVTWRDPWTAETRSSTINCPDRLENGEPIEAIARPGQELATTGEPYLGLIFAGVVTVMALPQVARRTALHLRSRSVLRRRQGTQPQTSGWRSSPRLEIGELDLASVADAVAIRAQLEGWHYRIGRQRQAHTVRPDPPQPWWRIRFLRRSVLTPTALGTISFCAMVLGLGIGLPLWQAAAVGGLAAAVWVTGWVRAVRRARRLAAALADPDPARMRYVLVTDPRGRLTALLYPGYGHPEQPVLSQPLAGALPESVALTGSTHLHDAGRYGQLLVVDDLVLWPDGASEPATPEATLDLVNGRR